MSSPPEQCVLTPAKRLDAVRAAALYFCRQLNRLSREVAEGKPPKPGKSVKCRCGRATVSGNAHPSPCTTHGTTASLSWWEGQERRIWYPSDREFELKEPATGSQETDLTTIAQSFAPEEKSSAADAAPSFPPAGEEGALCFAVSAGEVVASSLILPILIGHLRCWRLLAMSVS